MLMEIQVVGSKEWFEDVMPMFKSLGFKLLEDLTWSDPETDGELSGYYYTYEGKEPISFNDFVETVRDAEKTIEAGEAPYIKIAIVPDKKKG